jgi:hypothetical protein
MTKFTVENASGNLLGRGLSLFEAAIEVLRYDGHEYQIRQDDDGIGWRLYTSTYSCNSTAYKGLKPSTIFSTADTETEATEDIMRQVVENAIWFKGCCVQTDADYDAMTVEVEDDLAKEGGRT